MIESIRTDRKYKASASVSTSSKERAVTEPIYRSIEQQREPSHPGALVSKLIDVIDSPRYVLRHGRVDLSRKRREHFA